MTDFSPPTDNPIEIPAHEYGAWPASKHLFDKDSVWAIRAAIAAGRPLLLRGEPGIGKSQLARAAAAYLRVPFLAKVIDERTECDDLLCYYDAVARVAAAQVCGLAADENTPKIAWKDLMNEENFLRPGVLWWAINWETASKRPENSQCPCPEPEKPKDKDDKAWTPESERICGPVVLIDEIDKADPSVPNGLLASLGNEGFRTNYMPDSVAPKKDGKGVNIKPLVIITTNEERELPPAFLRRCFVHTMLFPKDPGNFLKERARVFWDAKTLDDDVLDEIVKLLVTDRQKAEHDSLPTKPGAAEFLDLARALAKRCPKDKAAQLECLEEIARFALKKNLSTEP
jgi:MoxR-like ATPase